MTSPKAASDEPETAGASFPATVAQPLGPVSLLILSAWCGLVAGLLEVATIVIRKRLFDANQLYGMSRHFVWMIPATNLCVFLALGVFGCVLAFARPGRGRWLFARVLCALTLLPVLLIAFPQIYSLAWLLVAFGVAIRLVPLLERRAQAFRRLVQISLPEVVLVVAILAATPWFLDRTKLSREIARPEPPPGSPNALLIVMDTVAAGHLSLHGYNRATSKTLIELAEQGIQFDSAQAAAPWTLPSHAAMFTGHWMHELDVGWLTPLNGARPTLAQFLGAKGYATAGFVANTSYCARDSGLDRGFTQYHDFIFPELTAFKKTVLVGRALAGIQSTVTFVEEQLGLTQLRLYVQRPLRWFDGDRKTAATVNRELLNWLSRRSQPERPFFAFLNYFDAHYPYQLPPGAFHRFGGAPADMRQRAIIDHWGEMDKSPLTPQELAFGSSAYDDCIADLDEQIGILLDKLRRIGVLEHTWLIIVADHGESFGEHPGVFCHGTSLYQTELHVPLLIVPPGGAATKKVVKDAVSLRELAATVVDVTDQGAGSPFPGQSLARFWDEHLEAAPPGQHPSNDPALAEVVPNPNAPGKRDPAGVAKPNWPLGALKDAEWSFIRREGDIREELFHLREDAKEERNRAADPMARETLERMRAALGQTTGGPLLPDRFRP
jgi:arylsulfatase A-like enzyme